MNIQTKRSDPSAHRRLPLITLGVFLLAVSCATRPIDPQKRMSVRIPDCFSSRDTTYTAPDRWWESFNDPKLTTLIEELFVNNLDLAQAWDRIAQAEAAARIQGAALLPQVNLQAGAGRRKTSVTTSYPQERTIESTSNNFFLSPTVSYEIDLWGRIRSLRNAAITDLRVTRKSLESTAIALTALTAKTWYLLHGQKAELALLREQLETNRQLLDLIELRFSQGKTTAVSVYQQQRQLALTRTRIPPIQSQIELTQHQLALLLAKAPKAALPEPYGALPPLPPLPKTGLPADLLRRRPDVQAAERSAIAFDWRLRAAIADQFPKLSLSAGISYQDDELSDLFKDWTWNIAGNLVQPLFDAGRRGAEVDRVRAQLEERLHAFSQTFLTAVKEVEDALTQERHQEEYIEELAGQIMILRKNLLAAKRRFVNGQSDYLPVLNALNTLQSLESDAIRAHRQLITYRIQLYESLGGTWPSELEQPNVTTIPAEKNTTGNEEKT